MTPKEADRAMGTFQPVKCDGHIYRRIEYLKKRNDYRYFAEMIDVSNCSVTCDVESLQPATIEEYREYEHQYEKQKNEERNRRLAERYESKQTD